ncbi:MAG TPA: hypothetical protein VF614_13050 [Chthoniobacteraceae bacterium]
MQKSILTSTLTLLTAAVATVAFAPTSAMAQAVQVDPAIKPYAKTSGVTGNLNSIGSDTLNNLMTLWLKALKRATRT